MFSFAFGLNPVSYFSGSTSISSDSLYRAQSDFIHSLAEQDSCVIVGRTSDYVLRDHPRVVNVFVHAPIKAKINKVNKLRANYYNFYTDKTWGDAKSYHLTFDTSALPMDDIVELIADYIRRRFKG